MRQFGALYRHHLRVARDDVRRADYRAGLLASIAFNSNIDPKETAPRAPEDFFPSLQELKPRRRRRQSAREIDGVFERDDRRRARREKAAAVSQGV